MRRSWALLGLLGAGCGDAVPTQGRNVVLVTMDTVRADHLGAYGHEGARTPVLDGLANDGVLFETAISVAPITMPTHSSIMTGLYPYHHGVRNNGSFVLQQDQHTMAERFRDAGYDTAAIVSAFVLDSKFGLDQGFRIYDDDLSKGGDPKMFMFKEVPADVSVDKAIALMDGELQEPFFLWLHLFDAHADYDPPPPYDVLFHQAPYDGEIAFVDTQLGRLRDAMERKGLDERTVFAVTADHGDGLGEHGEQTHGIFIYRDTTHVPWIVHGADIPPQRVADVVSQVDMAPTLTELVGLPAVASDGLSLAATVLRGAPIPARDGVYSESLNPRFHFGWHELRGIDSGDSKYILAPREEQYDLVADPEEADNLFDAEHPPPQKSVLMKWTDGDDLDALRLETVDHETADMLTALGYATETKSRGEDAPDPKDAAHRWSGLQRCQALVRHERHEEGRDCLVKVLEEDPHNWTARMSLAGVHRRLRAPEKALDVLDVALADDPTNVKTLLSVAATKQMLGRLDEAEADLRAAAAATPADPEPWTVLGDMFDASRRPRKAIEAYAEALRRDDTNLPAHVGVSNALHHIGDSDRAFAYLERATELDPRHLAAWYNKGVVMDGLGRIAGAEEAYRTAIDIDPRHAMSWNNLGSLLRRLERTAEAEAAFKRALAVHPDHVEARYNLATLLADHDPATAISLFERVLADRPDLHLARHNLALALRTADRHDEAIKHLNVLAGIEGADPSGPWLTIASIEASRGRTSTARRYVRKAIDRGGDTALARAKTDPDLRVFVP